MNSFRIRQQSYFRKILGSFLAISLLIIIVSGALYFQSSRRVINTAFSGKNLTTISQVSHMFDLLHSQLIPGLKEASTHNNTFTRLMYERDLSDRELLNGVAALDDLLLSYPLINSLYVYNGQMNTFLTTSRGLIKSDDFFDIEVLDLFKNSENRPMNRYWPRVTEKQLSYNEIEEGPVLTLIMGSTSKTNLKGAFISNIDVVELQNLLNTEYGTSNDEIFVINDYGELICQSLDASIIDIDSIYKTIKLSNNERGVFTTDDNLMVSYQYNHRLGWYFIGAMSLDTITKDFISFIRTIVLIMIGILMASIVLSYFVTKHVYSPINSLMNIFDKNKPTGTNSTDISNSNEISYIAECYKNILNERNVLEDSLDDLQFDNRVETFRSLLSGQEYLSWEKELEESDLDLMNRPLSLFLIQIDGYAGIIETLDPESFRQLRQSIMKRIEETLKDRNSIIVDMDVCNIICIIPGLPEERLEVMSQLQASIKSDLSCSVTIAWNSRLDANELKLKTMYIQLLAAAGSKFSLGFGQIIPYNNQDIPSIIFPGLVADKLTQFLHLGHLPEALQKLNELSSFVENGSYQDFIQNIRIFAYKLLVFIKDKDYPEIKKMLQQIRAYPETIETLDGFSVLFKTIIEDLYNNQKEQCGKGRDYYILIDKYINSNFKDSNCCVQSISGDLDLSPNYIRQIYKQNTGHSLSDDLVLLRIEEACRLLSETSDPVKEIYELAGFTNYTSFFTCFKRIKGKTPAEFRRNSAFKQF